MGDLGTCSTPGEPGDAGAANGEPQWGSSDGAALVDGHIFADPVEDRRCLEQDALVLPLRHADGARQELRHARSDAGQIGDSAATPVHGDPATPLHHPGSGASSPLSQGSRPPSPAPPSPRPRHEQDENAPGSSSDASGDSLSMGQSGSSASDAEDEKAPQALETALAQPVATAEDTSYVASLHTHIAELVVDRTENLQEIEHLRHQFDVARSDFVAQLQAERERYAAAIANLTAELDELLRMFPRGCVHDVEEGTAKDRQDEHQLSEKLELLRAALQTTLQREKEATLAPRNAAEQKAAGKRSEEQTEEQADQQLKDLERVQQQAAATTMQMGKMHEQLQDACAQRDSALLRLQALQDEARSLAFQRDDAIMRLDSLQQARQHDKAMELGSGHCEQVTPDDVQRLKQVLVDDRGAVQDQKEIERGRDPYDDSDERNADADVFKEIEEREAARSARDDERRSLQVAVQKAMIENDIDREREDRERELEAQILLLQQCLDALQASISVFAAGSNSKIGEGDRKDQHRSEGQKFGPPECSAAEGRGRRGAAGLRTECADTRLSPEEMSSILAIEDLEAAEHLEISTHVLSVSSQEVPSSGRDLSANIHDTKERLEGIRHKQSLQIIPTKCPEEANASGKSKYVQNLQGSAQGREVAGKNKAIIYLRSQSQRLATVAAEAEQRLQVANREILARRHRETALISKVVALESEIAGKVAPTKAKKDVRPKESTNSINVSAESRVGLDRTLQSVHQSAIGLQEDKISWKSPSRARDGSEHEMTPSHGLDQGKRHEKCTREMQERKTARSVDDERVKSLLKRCVSLQQQLQHRSDELLKVKEEASMLQKEAANASTLRREVADLRKIIQNNGSSLLYSFETDGLRETERAITSVSGSDVGKKNMEVITASVSIEQLLTDLQETSSSQSVSKPPSGTQEFRPCPPTNQTAASNGSEMVASHERPKMIEAESKEIDADVDWKNNVQKSGLVLQELEMRQDLSNLQSSFGEKEAEMMANWKQPTRRKDVKEFSLEKSLDSLDLEMSDCRHNCSSNNPEDLQSRIRMLTEQRCVADNKCLTMEVQLNALQSQLDSYRQLGFVTLAEENTNLDFHPANTRDMNSNSSINVETGPLRGENVMVKSQQHPQTGQVQPQKMSDSPDKHKAAALRWHKSAASLALSLQKISARVFLALSFAKWVSKKKLIAMEKVAKKRMADAQRTHKTEIAHVRKECEQACQQAEQKIQSMLVDVQGDKKSLTQARQLLQRKETELAQLDAEVREMRERDQQHVQRRQHDDGKERELLDELKKSEERIGKALLAPEEMSSSLERMISQITELVQTFCSFRARASIAIDTKHCGDAEAALLMNLSSASDSGPPETNCESTPERCKTDAEGVIGVSERIANAANTGMLDALFVATARVELLERQLATAHSANRDSSREIDALNALLAPLLRKEKNALADSDAAQLVAGSPQAYASKATLPVVYDVLASITSTYVPQVNGEDEGDRQDFEAGGLHGLRAKVLCLLNEIQTQVRQNEKSKNSPDGRSDIGTGAGTDGGEQFEGHSSLPPSGKRKGNAPGLAKGEQSPAVKAARSLAAAITRTSGTSTCSPRRAAAPVKGNSAPAAPAAPMQPTLRGVRGALTTSLQEKLNLIEKLQDEMKQKDEEIVQLRMALKNSGPAVVIAAPDESTTTATTELPRYESGSGKDIANMSSAQVLDGNILHLEQGDVVRKVYTNSSSLMNTDLTEKNLEIAQLKAELAEVVRQRNIAKVEQMRERESNEELRQVHADSAAMTVELQSSVTARDVMIRDCNLKIESCESQIAVLTEKAGVVEERDREIRESKVEIQELKERLRMACDTSIASLKESKRMTDNKSQEITQLQHMLRLVRGEKDGLESKLLDAVASVNELQHKLEFVNHQMLLKDQEIITFTQVLQLNDGDKERGLQADQVDADHDSDASPPGTPPSPMPT